MGSIGVICCRVLLRISWFSAWLRPPPFAPTTGFVFWKHFRSQSGGGRSVCLAFPAGHTDPTPDPFLAWDGLSPATSAPNFQRLGAGGLRESLAWCPGQGLFAENGPGESFPRVGGIRHFFPRSLPQEHPGWRHMHPVVLHLVGLQLSVSAPGGGGCRELRRQAPLAFAGPRLTGVR